MGLFNRAPRDPAATGTGRRAYEPHTMATKPSFGQWIKIAWVDILTMVIMGVLGLGIYMAPPAANRSFPVLFQDNEVVYPQFAYPLRKEIIPIWLSAFLSASIPIAIFLLMQIRVRSFWDVNNAITGLLYSLITAAVFQVFVKCLIGGLRPHFLVACQPDITRAGIDPSVARDGYSPKGFNDIYFTREICTGDPKEINDSLESMPSGHTTAAFAGFIYLYLYLNAKLKVFANYHPAMWKLVLLYAPVLGACLIGGALTIDEYHNWYDVFAGAVIGTVMAFSAYRMTYAAIWDWRYNHIPLHRGHAFSHGHEGGHSDGFDSVGTRRAGWGHHGLLGEKGTASGHNNGLGGLGLGHRKPVAPGTHTDVV